MSFNRNPTEMVESDLGTLLKSASAFAETKVVCLGDVMLDRFVYGKVDRISPEAPIPIIRIENDIAMLGGAGNVARNLTALGAMVEFISVVGADDVGENVKALLADYNKITPNLVSVPGRLTTKKTRYVADGQQLMRADREVTNKISDETMDQLCSTLSRVLHECQVLVISDYGKGVVTDRLVSQIISLSTEEGIPVIVDPKSRNLDRYRGATLITPNLKEFSEAIGAVPLSESDIVHSARNLLERFEIGSMLVTRGASGMSLISLEQVHHFPSRAREIFDVSGAGDTVVASLAASLAAGMPLVSAVQIANLAAGIVVGKTGTAVIKVEDLLAEITEAIGHSGPEAPVEEKMFLEQIQTWRERGERVGFTNGCFDLLHPGHISLLSQARANCDRLVVGLNSDSSVKRLKGKKRPVQNETTRASVLTSLEIVDLVIIFAEDTPQKLLQQIRPDVLIKGADYTIEKIVGADFVQSYGGQIVLADILPGFSTTETISHLNAF